MLCLHGWCWMIQINHAHQQATDRESRHHSFQRDRYYDLCMFHDEVSADEETDYVKAEDWGSWQTSNNSKNLHTSHSVIVSRPRRWRRIWVYSSIGTIKSCKTEWSTGKMSSSKARFTGSKTNKESWYEISKERTR